MVAGSDRQQLLIAQHRQAVLRLIPDVYAPDLFLRRAVSRRYARRLQAAPAAGQLLQPDRAAGPRHLRPAVQPLAEAAVT
ncbi:hypothetical protein D3C76_1521160 [compost metagenome]